VINFIVDCVTLALNFMLFSQILPFIVFHLEFFRRFLLVCILRTQKFRPEYLLPVLELLAMLYLNSASSFWRVYWLWVIVHAWCSWWFVATSVSVNVFNIISHYITKCCFFKINLKQQWQFGRCLLNWIGPKSSFCASFVVVVKVTASHHHPNIYHAGDEPRADKDWGLHQV